MSKYDVRNPRAAQGLTEEPRVSTRVFLTEDKEHGFLIELVFLILAIIAALCGAVLRTCEAVDERARRAFGKLKSLKKRE